MQLKRFLIFTCITSLFLHLAAAPIERPTGPGPVEAAQISEQELAQMFGVSPEEAKQMAQMMTDFDAAIKKDPELQKMFNELEKQLEHDIEEGIKEGKSIEEILGLPGTVPTPAPAPAAAPTPAPTPVAEQKVEEKPKLALRSRGQAEQMVQDLRNTIIKIQTKAAADRKVAETLAPLQPNLELIVYYLHVISKPAHLDQLVTDPEMTQLHDTLQQLYEKLSAEEPLFETPELGEELDKRTKERSKLALQNIMRDIQNAVRNQQLIAQFEKRSKKI